MRSVFLKSFLVNGFFIKLGRLEESVDWEGWGRKLNSLGLVSLYKKNQIGLAQKRFGLQQVYRNMINVPMPLGSAALTGERECALDTQPSRHMTSK